MILHYGHVLFPIDALLRRLPDHAEVREKVVQMEASGKTGEELEKLRERIGVLEVQSEVNRPSVRWAAANGMGEFFSRSMVGTMPIRVPPPSHS